MQHIRHLEDLAPVDAIEVPFCAWERHTLRAYALAVLRPEKGGRKVRLSSDFLQWYRESGRRLGLDVAALNTSSRSAPDPFACIADVNLPITRRELDACAGKTPTRRSGLAKRLDWVARLLGLPEREAAVLGAVVRLTGLGAFREFRSACSGEALHRTSGRSAGTACIVARRSVEQG